MTSQIRDALIEDFRNLARYITEHSGGNNQLIACRIDALATARAQALTSFMPETCSAPKQGVRL